MNVTTQYWLDATTKCYALVSGTVSNAVLSMTDFGFTAAQLADATRAFISCATAAIRTTWDGTTDPSVTVGHLFVQDGAPVELVGVENITNLRMIRAAGADAVVTISLER